MIGKQLENVPQEHIFRLKGGQAINNLYELSMHLAGMDDATFMHHVNDEKNDFRNWIFHIVKDEKLADDISAVKDRKKMAKLVENRVKELEMCKRHHQCELRKGINCGIREFGIGLVTGLFIGLIFLRAFGRI